MSKHYCPFCQREIEPYEEDGEIVVTQDGGLIFVHDAVPHDDDFMHTKKMATDEKKAFVLGHLR